MKQISLILLLVTLVLFSCKKDDNNDGPMESTFTVTIENVSTTYDFFAKGVFNTPVGAMSPAAAMPGESYEFMFNAGDGHKLSFATMYVQSNDLFYAPSGEGIDLYDMSGDPISGDITSMIHLWDAGTEVNEEPGIGDNQPPRQSGPNTGTTENGTIKMISDVNDGFTYPAITDVATFTLTHMSGTMFKLTIAVKGSSSTPLAPGIWVIHSDMNPLFTQNSADAGNGLEALAEDGDPANLDTYLEDMTGLGSPIAPGVFAVHNSGAMVLFENGTMDKGEGLEALAEDGEPSGLIAALSAYTSVSESGVFNTPLSASSPAPAGPGESYQFTFKATKGNYLSFATMFVQSNDLFYAPSDMGIALFNGDIPISGDITSQIMFWDAGTEMNEYPGIGANQAPRQSGANTGTTESVNIGIVNDGYSYPDVADIIKVTITSN